MVRILITSHLIMFSRHNSVPRPSQRTFRLLHESQARGLFRSLGDLAEELKMDQHTLKCPASRHPLVDVNDAMRLHDAKKHARVNAILLTHRGHHLHHSHYRLTPPAGLARVLRAQGQGRLKVGRVDGSWRGDSTVDEQHHCSGGSSSQYTTVGLHEVARRYTAT